MDLHLMPLFLEGRAKQSLCSPGQHLRQVICILSSEAALPSWMLDLSKDTIQVEISVLLRLRQAMSIWGYPCWVVPNQLTKLLPRYVLILWLDSSLQVGNWANSPSHPSTFSRKPFPSWLYTPHLCFPRPPSAVTTAFLHCSVNVSALF